MFIFTIFFLFLVFLFSKTAVIVPAREKMILERLGKYRDTLNPGLHFLVPFIDTVSYRHEMREQVIEIPPQSCITKDNIQVEVDGIVYLKVMDAQLASYGIENYNIAAINLAQTTMRSEIGKLTLHESFSEREKLNEKVVCEIDKASRNWGIKLLRYEIMNINPTEGVVKTLEQAMEAERERRSEVTLATAQKEALSLISEGKKIEAINISEGKKTKQINEAEGKAQEISIVAEAVSYSIKKVGHALSKPYGDKALKMKIIEQFIDQFEKIVGSSHVTVLPSQLANIKGFFEGMGKVTNHLNQK